MLGQYLRVPSSCRVTNFFFQSLFIVLLVFLYKNPFIFFKYIYIYIYVYIYIYIYLVKLACLHKKNLLLLVLSVWNDQCPCHSVYSACPLFCLAKNIDSRKKKTFNKIYSNEHQIQSFDQQCDLKFEFERIDLKLLILASYFFMELNNLFSRPDMCHTLLKK